MREEIPKTDISKKYKDAKIRDSFIKDKIYVFLNSVIENPSFSSQTKDSLASNVKEDFCNIKNSTMKNIIDKLDLTSEIISFIKANKVINYGLLKSVYSHFNYEKIITPF